MSGPRTLPRARQESKVEIRIENRNWSTARVYVAANGSRPQRIAMVSTGSTETKYVRINATRFVFLVSFLASNESWISYPDWSSEERCLHITVMNALFLTNVVTCRRTQ